MKNVTNPSSKHRSAIGIGRNVKAAAGSLLGALVTLGGLGLAASPASAASARTTTLRAIVFDDANENGVQDAGEGGVAGASVQVARRSRIVAEGATGGDGSVRFERVSRGLVRADLIWPAGLTPTSATEVEIKLDASVATVTFGLIPTAERTVDIANGDVTTLAGNGGTTTIDGAAHRSSFTKLRGLALANDELFVESFDTIRSIDIDSGDVSTVAGAAGQYGCTDGVGANARFKASGPMATDGTSLYVADLCGSSGQALRKIDIATGAVSTLWSTTSGFDRISGISVAPDGTLYTASTIGSTYFTTVIRKWSANGSVDIASLGATVSTSYIAGPLVVDRTGAYVVTTTLGTNVTYDVRRFDLATYDWTKVATLVNGPTAMASAGKNLYVGTFASLVKVEKATGAQTLVAGHVYDQEGYADGVGQAVRFNGIAAIVSDGQGLYVADTNNFRIRLVTDLAII